MTTPAAAESGKIAPVPENIPVVLKERPQWVCWRLEERKGKLTKVPYSPESFEKADSTDLMTWSTFDDAVAALTMGNFDGIGFVFCSADPFVGIDLDGCRNPETGEVEEWAQEILQSFENAVHVEVSPSGRGIHLITEGKCKDGVKRPSVEVYGQDRFFTITGVAL
jgi:primase-polymerase (primpol)-like protein